MTQYTAEGCTHCWHDEGFVLTSMPPQYPQICCKCGEKRVLKPTSQLQDTIHSHGPFAPKAMVIWDKE